MLGQGTRGKLVFAAAIVAGASYMTAEPLAVTGAANIAWKGAGVSLLALWAMFNGCRTIALVLAFGALGDVLLDAVGLTAGAVAFLIGHLLATAFFASRRARPLAMTAPIVVLVPLVAWLLPADRALATGVALYATALGAMTAAAWASRFPAIVPVGATLFVLSDWLIFARLGPLAASAVPDLLVWPLYFAGQALIAAGVVASARGSSTTSSHRVQ